MASKVRHLLIFSAFIYCLVYSCTRRVLPNYEINLDLPPSERFRKVNEDHKDLIMNLYQKTVGILPSYIKALLRVIFYFRTEKNELLREFESLSQTVDISLSEIKLLSLYYEFTTISFSNMHMCLGLIGRTNNGTIYHGRNLDLGDKDIIAPLLYDATFTKNNQTLFKAQMMAGYHGVTSGLKAGKFGLSEATRHFNKTLDNFQLLYTVFTGRTQATWLMRKVLETANSYEEALNVLSKTKITAPIYYILSGIDDGAVISRNANSPANIRRLGKNTTSSPQYIIQSNYDTFYHDKREDKDPRRIIAEDFLSNFTNDEITPELIFRAIDHEGVRVPKTFWQGLFSAKDNYWNSTSPIDL